MYCSLPGRVICQQRELCAYCDKDKVCTLFQGKMDSDGFETIAVCEDCKPRYEIEKVEARKGNCEWCGSPSQDLCWMHDDGKSNGPVYRVCRACMLRQLYAAEEEYEYEKFLKDDRCPECKQVMSFEEFKTGGVCYDCR